VPLHARELIFLSPTGPLQPAPADPLNGAHLTTEPTAALDIDPYTLVLWRVRPGRREDFLHTWRQLLARLRQLERPPLSGTLLESVIDNHQFYSVAGWDLLKDVTHMRRDPECRQLVTQLQTLCEHSAGGSFARVLSLEDTAG